MKQEVQELVRLAKELTAQDTLKVAMHPIDNEVINMGLKHVLEYLSEFAREDIFNASESEPELQQNALLMSRELAQLAKRCRV